MLIARKNIAALARKLHRREEKIVFTTGVFHILPRGHVTYLAKAKSLGEILIVGLNSDASVRRLKGPSRPLQKQRDRATILLALEAVDYVVLFGEDTPDRLIRLIKPDILAKGADYKVSEIVGASFVKSYGGKVKRLRLTPGKSTSALVKNL